MMQTAYCQMKEKIEERAYRCGRNGQDITLIVVSKGQSPEVIQSVYQEGGREFGESRVQEGVGKIPLLPPDCHWHLIGPLQSNKIKKAIASFSLIHSVDTPELAKKISEASRQLALTTSILLQVNVSREKMKQGLCPEEWEKRLSSLGDLSHVKIKGLMTLAPYTEDVSQIRACFRKLYKLREKWQKEMREPENFRHLSMGMSHDYGLAIEEGATLLRVGSAIFSTHIIVPEINN